MKIINVKCRYFRNIESCNIHLNKGINVIVGKNGQGKTNFLESIYYLSTTRSFRVLKDQDLIQHGKELSKIEASIIDNEILKNLACVIHSKGKTCFIGNQQISKTSEFAGKLNAILFAPSDLEIFYASPKVRRRLMDVEIGKIDSYYSFQLNRYNRLMKERNSSLKMEKIDHDILDALEEQMIDAEKIIIEKRLNFIHFINNHLSSLYHSLSGENNRITCQYKGIVECIDDNFFEEQRKKFKETRQRDWILKVTTHGIHRDDLSFEMDGNILDHVASQGQRRMTVLSLKLAFISYVIEKTGRKPILLLDDVLSELDSEKRKNLFNSIPEGIQTIITTTELDEIIKELPLKPKVLVMDKGKMSE